MKKILLSVVFLLLLGIAGAGTYLFMTNNTAVPGQAVEVGKTEKNQTKQPNIGVMKPIESPADIKEQLGYQISQNPDTVGWLKVPNTVINDSVVQSYNNVYYLRLNEKKEQNIYGCYFADYTCSFGSREELSQNTIIYGHSDLKDDTDGPKFSQLLRFTKEEFAKANPYVYFSTLQDQMTWQIFAVFYTDTGMDYIESQFSGGEFAALVAEAKQKSLYQYDVEVGEEDKILTLSTCTVKYGERRDQRFVVMAKLMPKDHVPVKTASLQANPNPRQPEF